MKKSQSDPVYKIDEFEDLTLFANESFDTEDVDLFEFSSEESSPLMRLKSIILSLDWEINDDILQELADEVEHLKSLWQNDKVAEVYLQGLDKIGGYIRSKGAYAHHNSIKLLLTFFYNFEKIISSPDITGDEITQLLTADVRKFRILQYQINQNETESTTNLDKKSSETAASVATDTPPAETDHAKQLKAAILSLDWEVTDESLKQFNTRLSQFQQMFTENKPALVLIQGLQVLGDYISEKRAGAHSEAFILLHSFNEGLEQIAAAEEQPLAQEKIQEILTDRISRINNLKMLVAGLTTTSLDNQIIDDFVDEINAPVAIESAAGLQKTTTTAAQLASAALLQEQVAPTKKTGDVSTDSLESEIDTLFAIDMKPAMESADVQYPDEIVPPDAIHPVDDELADDFIEAHLSTNRGIKPALSDTDESFGFNEATEPLDLPAQIDLAEQLDFLFPESDTVATDLPKPSPAMETSAPGMASEEGPVAALADVLPDLPGQEETALADTQEPADGDERRPKKSDSDQDTLDIQSKLDDFFADAAEEPVNAESASNLSVEEIERSLFFNEESSIESALADSKEEHGFSEEEAVGTLDYTPMGEIEEKLDFFFGTDTDDEPLAELKGDIKSPAATILQKKEEQSDSSRVLEESLDRIFEDSQEHMTTTPALSEFSLPASAETREDFATTNDATLDNELEGALDYFFEANEDDEEDSGAKGVDQLTQALEATIDAKVAAVRTHDEQPAAVLHEESRKIQLAALGALLPGVVRATSREKVAESSQLIAALQSSELPADQLALVQLLNSVINLQVHLPHREESATEGLVNYLYEQLLNDQQPPEVLPEAVNRFTSWLHDALAIMPPLTIKTGSKEEPHLAYTAKELYYELTELRGYINDEFAKLRHELHHKT